MSKNYLLIISLILLLLAFVSCRETSTDGKTPYIQDDYWYIDGINTGVKATGERGATWTVGNELPTDAIAGDMMLNSETFDIYQYNGTNWEWKANIQKDNSKEDEEEQKIVDLVIFVGQSNMAGRGTASEAPAVPVESGYEFRAVSDPTKLYPIVEPFGVNENNAAIDDGDSKTGSLVSALVNSYYQCTGVPIVGVSASQGGQSIDFWATGTDGLNETVARYNSAKDYLIENGYTIRHSFMVWLQGEADGLAGMQAEIYKEKLIEVSNQMKSQGVEATMVIRIGERNYSEEVHDEIIKAQTALCRERDDFVMISGMLAGLNLDDMKDYAHFTQATYNMVGADAGKNMAYFVNTGMEPYFYDEEYQNYYPFFTIDTDPPSIEAVTSLKIDVSDTNSSYNFDNLGVVNGDKVTIAQASKDNYLELTDAVVLSDDYSWTYQIIAGNFIGNNLGAGMIANSGTNGSGFITVPYMEVSSANSSLAMFRFRDEGKSLQIDIAVPEDYDPKEVHHFALTYAADTKIFKAYIDKVECEITYQTGVEGGTFNDTELKNFLGGYPVEGSNFAGDFYYFEFTKDVLTVDEMYERTVQ